MNKKDSFILEATIYPKNASNEKLIWSSSSEDVVVPETNDIYPNQIGFWCKACGTATITCIAADGGGATATCLITVVDGEKHWIKAKTVEGIEMVYYVEDATNGTCMVEGGGFNRNAQGTVTIPEIVEGEHIWESELGIERLRVVGLCNEAFAECHELTSINLPASIRTIGKNAFGWTGITSITIPDGVTELDDGVCYKCEKLVSANLPDGITKVGDMTFDGCHNLISVVIPNSVTAIGRQAFHDCHSLASISIPDGVTTIGYSAFERCVSLSSVIIPGSVTSIEDKAFDECYNLTQIQSDIVSPMPITNNTFTFIKPKETGHYELFSPTLYVPVGSKAVYQETEGWKRFVIVEGTIDASAIEDIQTDKTCDTVYSLSAQRLTSSRKGINIVGGKKIIVK